MTDINFCRANKQNLSCKLNGPSMRVTRYSQKAKSGHSVQDVSKSAMSPRSINVEFVQEKKADGGAGAVTTDFYSADSGQLTRQIYEEEKPKHRCKAKTNAVTDAEPNGSVKSDIGPQKEGPVTWSLEKEGLKDSKSQNSDGFNHELIVTRQEPFRNMLKDCERKKEQQSKSTDLKPKNETQHNRKTKETSKLQVFNAKQRISSSSSNKSKEVKSDSLFEEEIKLDNNPLFTNQIPSDRKELQLEVLNAQKNQLPFGNKPQTKIEKVSGTLLQPQPVKASPEFTNEDFPDIRANVSTEKVSSDNKNSSLPQPSQTVPKISYSAALRAAPRPKPLQAWQVKQDQILTSEEHSKPGLLKLSGDVRIDKKDEKKKKKKNRKKKVKEANQEAVEKIANQASGKRTALPIQFDLGEILASAMKTAPKEKSSSTKLTVAAGGLANTVMSSSSENKIKGKITVGIPQGKQQKTPHNMLDSTAPVVKRGKEREIPAKKKPSAMKKIILKEREEKKKIREKIVDSDEENKKDDTEEVTMEPDKCVPSSMGYELQAVSVPDSAAYDEVSSLEKEVASQIHSRRFREYCDQVLEKGVDDLVSVLLKELVRFQDRQYHKDPLKAKAKRRLVMGIREVTKHLKLRRLKCLIISPNIERVKAKGGLDDALTAMTNLCQEYNIPIVFALKRQALGRVLCKKVPVSVVGIFNYDGAQEYFKVLMERTEMARQKYIEMRKAVQQEIQEHSAAADKATSNLTLRSQAAKGYEAKVPDCISSETVPGIE